ncbi:Uncharacterised protein [Mycobacteroides abscessus subsp. abscessus]|nr:Uncharacterised protein [Mycobacteroides abscessus subsp. abscessus]
MSDPSVEAAQRALAEIGTGMSRTFTAEAAAREMAKSVQELIVEARTWRPYNTRDIGEAYCADTVNDFLDELAKRVYPSEELER